MGIYHTIQPPIPGSAQVLTIATASATTSSQFPQATVALRVAATTGCWYAVNTSASATKGSFLPGNVIDYVPAGASATISVLAATTAGSFYVTPLCG